MLQFASLITKSNIVSLCTVLWSNNFQIYKCFSEMFTSAHIIHMFVLQFTFILKWLPNHFSPIKKKVTTSALKINQSISTRHLPKYLNFQCNHTLNWNLLSVLFSVIQLIVSSIFLISKTDHILVLQGSLLEVIWNL